MCYCNCCDLKKTEKKKTRVIPRCVIVIKMLCFIIYHEELLKPHINKTKRIPFRFVLVFFNEFTANNIREMRLVRLRVH